VNDFKLVVALQRYVHAPRENPRRMISSPSW
jgi:hypothetical protein